MFAMISSIFAVLALLLEIWMQNRPTAEEKRYADIQEGRQDIAAGDVAAVNGRIDRMLSVPAGAGNTPGEQCSEITPGRIGAILGVAAAGRGTGADTGKS